ncbi:MAG: hypothetical protein IKK11_01010 [Oscillospiraceae bacterium]|nr:hypothetical protein [Oscillospiraceae bacterium]
MEKEYFFTGYCRNIDQSRVVAVVVDDSELQEVDCCFASCIHVPNCTIAKEIQNLTENAAT